MKLRTIICVFVFVGLFGGGVLASQAEREILPNSSKFYQLKQEVAGAEQLQIQVIIEKKKVSGFRSGALYVKINEETLKPVRLIERKPKDAIKKGRSCTSIASDGGITVPFTPSVEAYDNHRSYALASEKSMSLYKFKLDGLLASGNNIVELQNATRDQAITVEFIKYDNKVLTPLKTPLLRRKSAMVKLPRAMPILLSSSGKIDRMEKIFEVVESADTQINWRGEPLISSEEISFYPDKPLSELSEKTVVRDTEGWKTVNAWSSNKDLPFRKEVAVSNDGREIELNFLANHPSYHRKEGIDKGLAYTLKLPLAMFKGMNYTAFGGRTHSPITLPEGILTDKTPNKGMFGTGVRWLAFEGSGRKIVFDFNPEGVGSYSDYGPGTIQGLWRVLKTPTHLELSFGIGNTQYGGVMTSKLRIFEGTTDDYLNRHAYRKYRYFSELPVDMQFCFGSPKHGKAFIQAGSGIYDDDKGFGWDREVELESIRPSGAVYTAACDSGPATFKCRIARPGIYVFTLRCAGYETPRGAFSLVANGKEIFSDLEIVPYTLKNISWSQWVENGVMELVLSGDDWAVSSLSVQMLQHAFEDFKFRRGYWLVDDLYEPHPLNASTCFSEPVKHDISITQIALPKKPITDPVMTPVITSGEALLPNQNAPDMRWRYNATIGTLGPTNCGTFTEFATPELIDRRLKEIKADNINTVLINGFLSRHTFPTQLDRVQNNIKNIAAAGHKLNMKIMDHQDLSLLWNLGSGFRVMCEELGMTQRTIDGSLPARGFCLTNETFKDFYYDWITGFIKETDIDGIMIDEACYHGMNFCGCMDCRKKFTADTGLTLPLDETSELLHNKSSKLWKTWLSWRMKVVGDWGVELRRRIMPFKPNFTIMRYTTHGGFSVPSAPIGYGATLSGAARSCDFLGTEIMSRNVMASYRAVYAFRKAKNSLREAFDIPVFGLVYSLQSFNFAYFGWAMNNMNAQVTWEMSGRNKGKDTETYTDFKGNMDFRLAHPVSDIAVFYSLKSRNWSPPGHSMLPETIGVSQALTDRHIMHDFFMERSIDGTFLEKYRAVILPNSCCISREHIEIFLRYARQGGTLYLTATTGLSDQMGNFYSFWPFAEVFGFRPKGGEIEFSKCSQIAFVGQTPVDYNKDILLMTLDMNSPSSIIAEAIAADGKAFQPLAIERKYGKGRVIYCATQLSGSNYERENTYGKKWHYKMNGTLDTFNGQMLGKVIGTEALNYTPVNIPRQVLTSVYRQTGKDKTTTMVHLLNATGVKRLDVGEIIPSEIPEPAWPALTGDLVFNISLPSLKRAYVISPDYQGYKPVKVQKQGNGRYCVTVHGNLLKKYSIIFMEH